MLTGTTQELRIRWQTISQVVNGSVLAADSDHQRTGFSRGARAKICPADFITHDVLPVVVDALYWPLILAIVEIRAIVPLAHGE